MPERGQCLHLGPVTGEEVPCKTCGGNVRVKLHACAVYGKCTTHKPVPNVACCLPDCKSFTATPGPASPVGREGPQVKLTVGMATYDEPIETWFTLQALRLYQRLDPADEVIVVDNKPRACKLTHEAAQNFGARYIHAPVPAGTAAPRERVFREAAGDVVVCMDCHVLLGLGALNAIREYFATRPGSKDMVQGPLLDDSRRGSPQWTHWLIRWRDHMLGTGECEPALLLGSRPYEIQAMGLGLFAMRKAAWPGFNRNFRGFGGEECYIHEKVRRAGGRVMCLPQAQWAHKFMRVGAMPYVNKLEDRYFNYIVGHCELGMDAGLVDEAFRDAIPAATMAALKAEAASVQQMSNEF